MNIRLSKTFVEFRANRADARSPSGNDRQRSGNRSRNLACSDPI